jgi:ketosteroid isomerase-like protein
VAAAPLHAQAPAESPALAEVRAAAAAYLQSLGRADGAAIAEFWTEDGVYIDLSGASHVARELVGREFAAPAPSATAEAAAAAAPATNSTFQLIAPTVAIEHSAIAPAADAAPQSASTPNFVAAWVKRNDRWQLALLREFPSAAVAPPAAPDTPLGELDWMVGTWTASEGATTAEMSVEWAADRTYLLQRFVAKRDGQEFRRGSQRLAWDPAAKQIRSWTFNADGGFGEASWRREGDVWIAQSAGVLADGRRQRAIHFWTAEGDDACWFKSLQGEVDGQPTSDLVLKFTRRRYAAP